MDSSTIPATSGIYRIVCIPTGKFYIGSAQNLRKRWADHRNGLIRQDHGNAKLQRAWNKYGEEAFRFEVIELVLTPFLLEREQYWLDKTQAVKKGFNIAPTAGSTQGRLFSQEAKDKIGAANRGKKRTPEVRTKLAEAHRGSKRSVETRAKMSAKLIGNTRNVGRKLAPEHARKLREVNIGKVPSDETRKIWSEQRTGRKHTPEAKEKMRQAHIGYKHTPEARAKMSAAVTASKMHHRKALIVTSPEGVEYSVVGIRQFCKEHSLDRSTLMRVAKGQYPHHKGWKARFPD